MKQKQILSGVVAMLLTTAGPAVASYISESEPNNSIAAAQNVDAFFSLDADDDITDATTVPHVSIRGNGNNEAVAASSRDFFSFNVAVDDTTVLFDIDYGEYDLDSWLNLYRADGTFLGSNDDGGIIDSGTFDIYDSYWSIVLGAGTYVVSVGRSGDQDLLLEQDYILHISVPNHTVPVPVPVAEPASLALLGIGLAGLGAMRRRKTA